MFPRLFLAILTLSSSYMASADVTKEERKAFHALVKAVERTNGFVHPSIGIVSPAPSGARRGIGIVKNAKPRIEKGSDIVIKIPYSYQMTRDLALSTITEQIPPMVLVDYPLLELDDAALLVLLLAHEYGLGKRSKFSAYIKTLPSLENGGCGWADVDDFRNLPPGVEVEDVEMAWNYAHRVSNGMATDYGEYLEKSSWPKAWKDDPAQALRWALCIVNSRGTAANAYPGGDSSAPGVRLVPLADLANHWKVTGGYIELSGKERVSKEDFMDAAPADAGAFVVRSTWKCGTTRELAKGDEITVNYNLPEFRAVDWFLSLGFVPKEVLIEGRSSGAEL
jgi:hypothetical protein